MADMVKVTALRAHRNGFAPDGVAAEGASFAVPIARLGAMVRQGLVEEAGAKPKKAKREQGPADDAENDS